MKQIETERFILKQTTIEDSKNIFEVLGDEETVKYLNLDLHTCIEDSEKLVKEYLNELEEKRKIPYSIFDKNTKEFIGVFLIKLDLYNEDAYEFTIYLSKKYWGQGIYKEVIPYMIKVAFEDVKTGNFRGYAMENNIASIKVLERSGFILEKIFEVPGLPGKIHSFLITKEMYEKNK